MHKQSSAPWWTRRATWEVKNVSAAIIICFLYFNMQFTSALTTTTFYFGYTGSSSWAIIGHNLLGHFLLDLAWLFLLSTLWMSLGILQSRCRITRRAAVYLVMMFPDFKFSRGKKIRFLRHQSEFVRILSLLSLNFFSFEDRIGNKVISPLIGIFCLLIYSCLVRE